MAGMLATFLGATSFLAYGYLRPWYTPWAMPLFSVGTELNRISDCAALVVVADYGVPTAIYYARRHGWHFPQGAVLAAEKYPVSGLEAVAELEKRRQHGASYVAFPAGARYWLTSQDLVTYLGSRSRRVRWTAEYVIFTLEPADNSTAGVAASILDGGPRHAGTPVEDHGGLTTERTRSAGSSGARSWRGFRRVTPHARRLGAP